VAHYYWEDTPPIRVSVEAGASSALIHPSAWKGYSQNFGASGGGRLSMTASKNARFYPLSYSSSSLTGTATLDSPPAFRRLLAENMAPLAGSEGAKFRKPKGCSSISR
jgi:hypothetical protein